jgi:two-component system sensor histidine kinase KdpD
MMDSLREYAGALAAVAACTAACFAMAPFLAPTNLVMVYLLGTLIVASRGHRGPAILASTLGVLCFDFFFVPPRYSFSVTDTQYVFTFVVMFIVAIVISHLTLRVHNETRQAEKERLRSSLLSSVSHDLRTPLAAIIGSASSLLQSPSAPRDHESRELLENIQSEGERLSRLVHNLIETTRLESGVVRLRKEACSLEELVGSALGRLDKLLSGRKVAVDLPHDLPLIELDGVLIEQVFINLLENAARHTPAKTPIELSAKVEKGLLRVDVADRGPGLARDVLEQVFEKFYHAKSSSAGAGLGLAICRAVINVHGGRIWADNRKDGGAVFSFTLPIKEPHA